jgi:signal transduction histidine kinase
MLGRSIFELVHADDRGAARAQIDEILTRPGASVLLTLRIAHADGSWRSMEGVGVNRLHEPPVGAVVINARDVTDQRRLELELRQSHKMEAVGRLAGGVAHDFNNLLTAILGYCNLMLDDVPKEDPLRTDLEEIRRAGQRAAALTQQLLAFSRRQMLQPQLVDMSGLVQQLEKMLRRLIGDDIELETRLAAGLDAVNVDPASVEQVLVNLALNARDAMPRGGRLTIETAGVQLDAGHADSHPAMAAGRYVMLAVADSGRGMDESTRSHVFEPFFTTKPQGQGDGLGLATVYGIVKQSGGYIWVFSEPERGTTFKVYFPPAEAAAPADI